MEIRIMKNIMDVNESIAKNNRETFKNKKITTVNVMASPGAGKTSVILNCIEGLREKINVSVIEGDISSSIDAEKIDKLGIPVFQINTAGGCHLDANMIKDAVEMLNVKDDSVLFIENVGNLVCPSSFDLGEKIKLVIASLAEGHDKPYKYIPMFESADVIILNKIDLLPHIDFDMSSFMEGVRRVNSKAPIFEISCRTKEGVNSFVEWLLEVCRQG